MHRPRARFNTHGDNDVVFPATDEGKDVEGSRADRCEQQQDRQRQVEETVSDCHI